MNPIRSLWVVGHFMALVGFAGRHKSEPAGETANDGTVIAGDFCMGRTLEASMKCDHWFDQAVWIRSRMGIKIARMQLLTSAA